MLYGVLLCNARAPLPSMAAAYIGVHGNRSEGFKTTSLASRLEEHSERFADRLVAY